MSATITAPLAPLTTVFTPPCSISWLLTSSKNPSQFPPFPTAGPASCDPPGWAANIAAKGFQYYSPAICPNGFEVGPSCQITKTRTTEGFPAVRPGETAAYCVPSGYTCTTDITDFRGGVWGATKLAGPPPFTVGPAIQIRFQESDLLLLETHPLTPGLTLGGLPTQTPLSASTTVEAGDSILQKGTPARFTTIPTPTPTLPPPPVPVLDVTIATSSTSTETDTEENPSTKTPSIVTLPSTPTDATVIPSNEQTPSSKDENPTGIAAIVLSAMISVLAISFTAYACLKGRHTSHRTASGHLKPKGLSSAGVRAWVGARRGDEETPPPQGPRRKSRRGTWLSAPRQARLGPAVPRGVGPPEADDGLRIPIFAQQAQDQRPHAGTPAPEPDASHDGGGTPAGRGSWVSRVSRLLSRAARSSSTSRSSSRSRPRTTTTTTTTTMTMTRRPASEEWEHFFLRGSRGPGGLTVPRVTYMLYTRPSSAASFFPEDHKDNNNYYDSYYSYHQQHHHPHDLEDAALPLPTVSSFDRLSEGTFGLRGRSSDRSSPNRNRERE